ncbi:MAG: zf-HC2 domain-containing protein [Rhizobium sp.]|nr:zf-HC2 domain-containing protein [Rhizobium sp.]
MMKCDEATKLVSDRLDRNLSIREGLALRLHLLACDKCTRFSRQMQAIRRISRAYVATDGSGRAEE